MEIKIEFRKGTKEPWKIVKSGKVVGAAMTKKMAEDKSKSMGNKSYVSGSKAGGVDEMLDKAISEAPAPMKEKIAATRGVKKKSRIPARGLMEGETAAMYEDEDEE